MINIHAVSYGQLLRNSRIHSIFAAWVFILAVSSTTAEKAIAEELAAEITVGQVTLLIGKAYRVEPDQSKTPITLGTQIFSGDQIVTRSNGHVHIRFNDQGLVSVRPDSRLEIEQYEFNATNPDLSTVKFNLKKGVARSVSGKAAKAARGRFRMNTPIAAIGVRGTDFVVSADNQRIRAIVNEGIIIVAPFSDQCAAESLGPCAINAVELSGGSKQLLELKHLQQTPQLMPMRDDLMPKLTEQGSDRDSAQQKESSHTEHSELYTDTLANKTLSNQLDNKATDSITPDVDFTPENPIAPDTLKANQLVWGRWSNAIPDGDTLTLPYGEASDGRKIAVGNNDYALFRLDNGSERVQPGLGNITFQLSSATAQYTTTNGSEAMKVGSGRLGINFNNNRFETGLELSHSTTGDVNFTASGKVHDGGFFNSHTSTQKLGGAVSLDGSEAGYFFSQQLNGGSIDGITLWNRP